MPTEMLQTIPGYDPDVEKSRAEAREMMKKAGYGPDKQLQLRCRPATCRFPRPGGDPDRSAEADLRRGRPRNGRDRQLAPKVTRKDYTVAMNNTGSGVDDPDQMFYENFACGSERNYSAYCNPEIDKIFDEQSMMPTRRSARSWSGKSTSNCRKTAPGR